MSMVKLYKDTYVYHGSRGGIHGEIDLISRPYTDFGRGFYMGENIEQAASLVSSDSDAYIYSLNFKLGEIDDSKILRLGSNREWAYFVLYNRGKLEDIKETAFYNFFENLGKGKDVIVGPIADDTLSYMMKRFIKGEITEKVYIESIKAVNYGFQYVAKTKKACSCIEILGSRELYGDELNEAVKISQSRREEGNKVAREIENRYRRDGLYIDEVLKIASTKQKVEEFIYEQR